jgi:hypothetical protein
MFGSTETCVFATRRTAQQDVWKIYDGITLEPRRIPRRFRAWYERRRNSWTCWSAWRRRLRALGRNSDLVEVAGKRASLADITRRLLAVTGVEDAVASSPRAPPPVSPTAWPPW